MMPLRLLREMHWPIVSRLEMRLEWTTKQMMAYLCHSTRVTATDVLAERAWRYYGEVSSSLTISRARGLALFCLPM